MVWILTNELGFKKEPPHNDVPFVSLYVWYLPSIGKAIYYDGKHGLRALHLRLEYEHWQRTSFFRIAENLFELQNYAHGVAVPIIIQLFLITKL